MTSQGEERTRHIAGYSKFSYENDGKGSADDFTYGVLPFTECYKDSLC
jgi:hypothetical protein